MKSCNVENIINLNNPFRLHIEARYGNTVTGIRLIFFTDKKNTVPMDFTGWTFEVNPFFHIEEELPNVLILTASADEMKKKIDAYDLDIKGTLDGVIQTIVAGKLTIKKDYLTAGCITGGSSVNLQYFNVIEKTIIQRDGWLVDIGLIAYEDGFVVKLIDWVEGEGDKPTQFIGWFMGFTGWVENIEEATIIGKQGLKGDAFTFDDFTPEQILLLQQPAIDAATIAQTAATNANNAALNANNAADDADTSAANADAKAELARQAAIDANTAAGNANIATGNANDATNLANQAADNANDKAGIAQTAADNADIAAGNANNAFNLFKGYVNALFGITQPELTAIISRAMDEGFRLPNQLQISASDVLITDLKNNNVFYIQDLLLNFAYNQLGLEGFSRINHRNPTGALATLNGGLINTLSGWEGNRVDGWIDTGFNPTIGSNKYLLNDAGRGAILYKEVNSSPTSAIDSAGADNNAFYNTVTATHRINSGNVGVDIDLTGIGYKGINRTSATGVSFYNKAIKTDVLSSSSAITPNTEKLFTRPGVAYSNLGISAYHMGGSLTETQTLALRTAYNKYFLAIGLPQIA